MLVILAQVAALTAQRAEAEAKKAARAAAAAERRQAAAAAKAAKVLDVQEMRKLDCIVLCLYKQKVMIPTHEGKILYIAALQAAHAPPLAPSTLAAGLGDDDDWDAPALPPDPEAEGDALQQPLQAAPASLRRCHRRKVCSSASQHLHFDQHPQFRWALSTLCAMTQSY